MNSTSPPPLRRMVPSTAPRVGFLATASPPKPPWTQLPPPRPPEVNRRTLNASEYPSASSSRSLSVPKSRKSTRAALIVAVPMPREVCVADQTSYEKTEDVSLHTCLNKPATRHLRPPVPSVEPHQPTADVPLAAPQHQLISNARPALEPYIPQHDQPLVNFSNDFDDFSTLTPFGSHDEYSLYNDFLPSSTNILPTVPTTDPFIESAAVPSSEEDILANVDVGDFEKEVDIGQWMKYLQDDSDTLEIPGLEENIFERVEQEPTTPELINESFRDDYFAVPNLPTSSGFGQQLSTQTELDPVQEFFPGMCVDISNAPTTAYDNGMATCPEWQTYQQYSPSHTPASIVSDVSSTTSWSTSSRTTSRKRPYPAPSVATTICDDDYRAKRDKNNRASQISRQKHKEKVESQKTEVLQLASKNEALKLEVETLEQQIATMRAVLMDSIGQAQK